jgi:hypothetical protein
LAPIVRERQLLLRSDDHGGGDMPRDGRYEICIRKTPQIPKEGRALTQQGDPYGVAISFSLIGETL